MKIKKELKNNKSPEKQKINKEILLKLTDTDTDLKEPEKGTISALSKINNELGQADAETIAELEHIAQCSSSLAIKVYRYTSDNTRNPWQYIAPQLRQFNLDKFAGDYGAGEFKLIISVDGKRWGNAMFLSIGSKTDSVNNPLKAFNDYLIQREATNLTQTNAMVGQLTTFMTAMFAHKEGMGIAETINLMKTLQQNQTDPAEFIARGMELGALNRVESTKANRDIELKRLEIEAAQIEREDADAETAMWNKALSIGERLLDKHIDKQNNIDGQNNIEFDENESDALTLMDQLSKFLEDGMQKNDKEYDKYAKAILGVCESYPMLKMYIKNTKSINKIEIEENTGIIVYNEYWLNEVFILVKKFLK